MLRRLWHESLIFRRIVASLSVGLAALALYFGSRVPQTATLPNDEVDKRGLAHANEEFRIYKPRVDAGDAVLSLEGSANVSVEVWAQQASLTGASAAQFGSLAPGAARAVYAATDTKPSARDCQSAVTVSRANGSQPPQQLRLWQRGTGREDQRFRQVIVTAPETAVTVRVSTDSAQRGQPCPRVLTMGGNPIDIPAGPVDLLVPANQQITLIFSSSDPDQTVWHSKKDTFDGLSLGDGDLKADGVDVVSTAVQKTPLLHVVAHRGTDGLTLHDLKLGAEQAQLSVGEDGEKADAWEDGKKFPVFDLVDKIQKNPVLGFFLAAVLIPGLWKWIQKTCFPKRKDEETAADATPKTD